MRLFLTITFLIFNLEAKSLFSNDAQAQSSVYISSLKDLVIATQKTRGLTNSYLNGNDSALLLVYANRQEMKKAIGIMESLDMATDPIINSRATAISQALVSLNNKAFKQKPSLIFSNYTEQIAQILMLAQTVAKRSAKDLNPFGEEVTVIMMEIILPMTEYVGQLRGLGSGLAAKGSINKQELTKINVLTNEIENLNTQLQSKMSELTREYPEKLSSKISDELTQIDTTCLAYTKFAKERFKNNINRIDPNSYFDAGTKLISQIVKVYTTLNEAKLEDSKGWI